MKFSLALTLLTACAFAQETPTEREAARVVLQKMDSLETSLDVPGWVAKLSAPDAARDAVTLRAKQLMDTEFLTMGDDITRHPEIGFQETRSVGILVDYLKAHNFDVTVGVAKLSTAFVARYQGNRGAPNLGVIVEYDALRGTNPTMPGPSSRLWSWMASPPPHAACVLSGSRRVPDLVLRRGGPRVQ